MAQPPADAGRQVLACLRARGAAEGLDHVRYLARLIELELLDREARMIDRRIKAAKFPGLKTLESFDFDALPGLNRKLVLHLARGELVALEALLR